MKFFYFLVVIFVALAAVMAEDPRCNQPIDAGLCYGHYARFGFDASQGKCVSFVYGGCTGNDNRFESLEECEAVC